MDNCRTTTFYGGGKKIRGRQAKGFAEEFRAFLDVCRRGGAWPLSWGNIVGTHRGCFAAMCSQTSKMVHVHNPVLANDSSLSIPPRTARP